MRVRGSQKLGKLVDRLVASQTSRFAAPGLEYMRKQLRYRLGLTSTQPHLPSRGRPLEVVQYERGLIDGRVRIMLDLPAIRDEVEAAGGTIR